VFKSLALFAGRLLFSPNNGRQPFQNGFYLTFSTELELGTPTTAGSGKVTRHFARLLSAADVFL